MKNIDKDQLDINFIAATNLWNNAQTKFDQLLAEIQDESFKEIDFELRNEKLLHCNTALLAVSLAEKLVSTIEFMHHSCNEEDCDNSDDEDCEDCGDK